MTRPFLSARWESLVLLNYACPGTLLEPLVPAGTELDDRNGQHYVSLVGFLFLETRVRGLAIPGYRSFEEANLRFYVRRTVGGETRRAVVFIRELVPRKAIAAVARWKYNEPYLAVPMAHSVDLDAETGGRVEYRWRFQGEPYVFRATVTGPAAALESGSQAHFITEHYWGYTRQRDGRTLEYRVEHPPWLVWEPTECAFSGDAARLYGPELGEVLSGPPHSAHVALGSRVLVHEGRVLPA